MKTTLIREIAAVCQARHNCAERGNTEWYVKHDEKLSQIAKNILPSGSGIDCGTKIDADGSDSNKVVLTLSFHHMNENGMYDGWTQHTITVLPAFDGVDLKISGRNRNEIKEYLHETYQYCLTREFDNEAMTLSHLSHV